MMILLIIITFIGFAVAAQIGDKKELVRRQENNEKLGGLINDLCKAYNIPIEDFKKFREKHNI